MPAGPTASATTWRGETELAFYESAIDPEPGMGGERTFEEFCQEMMSWRFGHPRGVLLSDSDLFGAFYAGDECATSMRRVRSAL
jgi:hypothetical protein